jgi:peroxiredoxin
MRTNTLIGIVVAALLGGVSGFVTWNWLLVKPPPASMSTKALPDPLSDPAFLALVPDRPSATDDDRLGMNRPPFSLPNLKGGNTNASEFNGKVVVVNFWATWCAPCREEIPMLADLHTEFKARGLEVLGVAMDDMHAVREFADEFAIPYALVVGQAEVMALGREYGNRLGGIPYTAILDRTGAIRHLKAGKVIRADLAPIIEDLL